MIQRLLAVLALILAAGALAPPAEAGYVFYFRVFGAWTVTCWQNEPTGHKDCNLTAPQADLSAAGDKSKVAVFETAPGAFAISVQLRGVATGAQKIHLAVDGGTAREATSDRAGLAGWDGAAAAKMVAAMRAGKTLTLRSQAGADQPAREEAVPLDGFAQALDVYRLKLRGEGVLKDG